MASSFLSGGDDDPFNFQYRPAKKKAKLTGRESKDSKTTAKNKSIKSFFPPSPRKKSTPSPRVPPPGLLPSSALFCRMCQMPLSLLGPKESPNYHESACLDFSFDNLPPCEMSQNCEENKDRRHFLTFSHLALAKARERQDSLNSPSKAKKDSTTRRESRNDESSGEDAESLDTDETHLPTNVQEHIESGEIAMNQVSGRADAPGGCQSETIEEGGGRTDMNSPVKLTATADSQKLTVKVNLVHPDSSLKRVTLQIPSKDKELWTSKQIKCTSVIAAKVNTQEAKERFKAIFAAGKKKVGSESEGGGDAVKEARKNGGNGHVAPTPDHGQAHPSRRKCPFYKRIPNTSFAVDAFSYGSIEGVTKYFLSHFHYDHYHGLTKSFSAGLIICSEITAKMIHLKIKVNPTRVRALPMDEPIVIDRVEVTLMEANHCPGAVMFLFKLTSGRTELHTGDFRACPEMESNPALWDVNVDRLYLDTTYCKPEYDFPNQADVIAACVESVKEHMQRHPKTLIIVGSYTIGKERIFRALAENLDCKVWACADKSRVLEAISDRDFVRRLVKEPSVATIHVMDMRRAGGNRKDLTQYLELFCGRFDHVLSIVPTGWTHKNSKSCDVGDFVADLALIKTYGNVSRLDVAYSEHSSFSELRRFVRFLKLRSANAVVPTVNVGSHAERERMKTIFQAWVQQVGPDGNV